MLVDSHCHLDFPELAADRVGVLARAKAAGVERVVTISTRVERFDEIRAIAEENAEVWCSVGTHPHHADQELHIQVDDLVRLAEHPKCIAIGEAGLDYFYDNAPKQARSQEQEIELLTDLCDTMKYGSLCALGGFTPYPVMSALKHWPEDFTGVGLADAAE